MARALPKARPASGSRPTPAEAALIAADEAEQEAATAVEDATSKNATYQEALYRARIEQSIADQEAAEAAAAEEAAKLLEEEEREAKAKAAQDTAAAAAALAAWVAGDEASAKASSECLAMLPLNEEGPAKKRRLAAEAAENRRLRSEAAAAANTPIPLLQYAPSTPSEHLGGAADLGTAAGIEDAAVFVGGGESSSARTAPSSSASGSLPFIGPPGFPNPPPGFKGFPPRPPAQVKAAPKRPAEPKTPTKAVSKKPAGHR